MHPILLAGLVSMSNVSITFTQPEMVANILTSQAGHKQAELATSAFEEREPRGITLTIDPDATKQTIDGIGSSFTESSAFVLAHLDPERRREVMRRIFSHDGANFTLTRMHIGACDFSVEGKYSYADDEDPTLSNFTIAPDLAGFDPATYPGIKDATYDLLPMIEEAQAIKAQQDDRTLRIIGSAWTAPPWMKSPEVWFIPGSEANDYQGTGGSLKPEHESTYAAYLMKFLTAYADRGVPIWAITPVNEPNGNGGFWESMHFSAESQAAFIADHLGPQLQAQHPSTKLLTYDQNRDELMHWADAILGNEAAAQYVYGTAVHWYASTVNVFEDALQAVYDKYPGFTIIHTEGCIDNLGNPAPGGIRDPEGFEETNFFGNDEFWWTKTATDWAYEAEWAGEKAADHPMYVPVHRYARNIIVSLDHWMTGWVDWNVVLDANGGPNHANNFCGAPIMIDTDTSTVYETPIYHVLSQFSRTIRPGDIALTTTLDKADLHDDALHACATMNDAGLISIQLLNTTQQPITLDVVIESHTAAVTLEANSVTTLRVQR